jgi:NADH:ubiquinone oxidoreductase subunit D
LCQLFHFVQSMFMAEIKQIDSHFVQIGSTNQSISVVMEKLYLYRETFINFFQIRVGKIP